MLDVVVMALVGAALVFAALAVVWAAIAVLVRVTAPRAALPFEQEPAEAPPVRREGPSVVEARAPPARDDAAMRAQAAAMAVAVAVATWEAEEAAAGSSRVSPWQAAMRAHRLQQKAPRGR